MAHNFNIIGDLSVTGEKINLGNNISLVQNNGNLEFQDANNTLESLKDRLVRPADQTGNLTALDDGKIMIAHYDPVVDKVDFRLSEIPVQVVPIYVIDGGTF